MQPVQQRKLLRTEVCQGGAQTGAGSAGIIQGMAGLGGALRVDAETDLLAGCPCLRSETLHLGGGVEDDMVGIPQQLLPFVLPVGRGEDMDLSGKVLSAQPRLIEAAGGAAGQVLGQQGVAGKHGEGLLSQQDLTAGLLLDLIQNGQVAPQGGFVHHEVRSAQFAHAQSTSTGFSSICQGRPQRFRASM